MAIAVSPQVAAPQRGTGRGPRQGAISLQHPSGGPPCSATRSPRSGPDDLLVIASQLATRARSWPGMTRPTRRRWELMAVSEAFEAWIIAWPPGGAIDL